jgi:hypothetical protein
LALRKHRDYPHRLFALHKHPKSSYDVKKKRWVEEVETKSSAAETVSHNGFGVLLDILIELQSHNKLYLPYISQPLKIKRRDKKAQIK